MVLLRRCALALLTPRSLHNHGILFAVVMGLLLLANLVVSGGWWTFWPMFCLSLLFAVHMFLVRSMNVDPAWVEERMLDTRRGSYDVSHILDIEERRRAGDDSVTSPNDRGEPRQ